MMKKWIVLGIVLAFFGACKERKPAPVDTVFRCTVAGANNEVLFMTVNGETVNLPLQNGKAEITFKQLVPQYSDITLGEKYYPIYLGGDTLEMTFAADLDNWDKSFKGEYRAICDYFYSGISSFSTDIFYKDEADVYKETEKLIAENIANLERQGLPSWFADEEIQRLRYSAYLDWNNFALYHKMFGHNVPADFKPGDLYYNTLEKLIKEDMTLFPISEYRLFLQKMVPVLADRERVSNDTPEAKLERSLNYVEAHFKEPKIMQMLVNVYVSEYIADNGMDNADKYIEIFKKYVTDEKLLSEFENLCSRQGELREGKPAPDFNYVDSKGQMVSLSSLRGNFVYIDVWASWCAPCRREIPALKELAKEFKQITFVGISVDKDEAAWKKALDEEKPAGIQLFVNGDLEWMKAFGVNSLPRFIFLDPEGNIVAVHATKPSDPETKEIFTGVLGLY